MGVEPTGDRKTYRPPVLKITTSVLTGFENFLSYLILQLHTSTAFCSVLVEFDPF